jgi:hypothetical protein
LLRSVGHVRRYGADKPGGLDRGVTVPLVRAVPCVGSVGECVAPGEYRRWHRVTSSVGDRQWLGPLVRGAILLVRREHAWMAAVDNPVLVLQC